MSLDFSAAERFANYTGRSNWEVWQPKILGTPSEYISEAQKRLGKYDEIINSFANSLPFKVNIIPACAKETGSSLRKLWDVNSNSTGRPERIKDYLRATIIVPQGANGIENLQRVMLDLMEHPDTIGYKDQFWHPNEETGYRSFKAIMMVDGMLAEMKVEYGGMMPANRVTEGWRHFERSLTEMEHLDDLRDRCTSRGDKKAEKTFDRLLTNAHRTIKGIRDMRHDLHEYQAAQCGINVLLDPVLQKQRREAPSIGQLMRGISELPFGQPLQQVLEKAGLIPSHT